MNEVTGFKPIQPEFEIGQIVAIARPHLIPPESARGGTFKTLSPESIGMVIDRFYVNSEESDILQERLGWHYAILSQDTETAFKAHENDLDLASDLDVTFEVGTRVVIKKELAYIPFFNANDNEIIPKGTRAIITAAKDPDKLYRIAPIDVYTRHQYFVRESEIELDEDDL